MLRYKPCQRCGSGSCYAGERAWVIRALVDESARYFSGYVYKQE
jgi:hypothetical protein